MIKLKYNTNHTKNMDIIKAYLTSGFLKKQSQHPYKSNITEYFKVIKENPNTYFKEEQDYKQDIMKYFRYLTQKDSHSIKHKLYSIKGLLEYNEIDLPNKLWKKLMRTQPSRALTIIRIPTRQQLKEILLHANAKERALFLTAITSGMRINEILNITLDNINLEKYPYQIDVPATITKTGESRITFINNETNQAIQQWLKIKASYLKSKRLKGTHLKGHTINKNNDNKIFPFTYETARIIWNKLITNAGYDQKDKTTHRYLYHIHTLRKYFINTASPIISRDIAETLAGHEEFLKKIYPTVSPNDLAEYYKKAIPNLNIFETEIDTTEIQEQQNFLQKQIDELKQQNEELLDLMIKFAKPMFYDTIEKIRHKIIKK